jgi:hypothetical protein
MQTVRILFDRVRISPPEEPNRRSVDLSRVRVLFKAGVFENAPDGAELRLHGYLSDEQRNKLQADERLIDPAKLRKTQAETRALAH